jgi:hypothetical protein
LKLDLISWYKIFLDLQDSGKDLETLDEISTNLNDVIAVAALDELERLSHSSDDTTMIYVNKLVSSCRILLRDLEPMCSDFLGISKTARAKVLAELPNLLVSYSLLLYKQFGYEYIAEDYIVNRSIDPSRLTLPKTVLEDIAEDMSRVMDTLRLILVIFQTFNAYFAEYQVSTDEDLADVIAALEDAGLGTEAIATLSEYEVRRILGGDYTTR